MITLHFYGHLATKYGDKLSLEAKTPREAIQALMFQCAEYKEHLRSRDWFIFVGKENNIQERELDLEIPSGSEVHLVPKIEGAGSSNAWMAVIGVALVATGFGVAAVGAAWATTASTILISAGVGLAVGAAIAHMMKPDESKTPPTDASFLFKGPTNSSEQGVAIPRGYGRCLVGSTVVSVNVRAE